MKKRSLVSFNEGFVKALLFITTLASAAFGQTSSPFSQDSAWATLNVLAGEIGPRPMGSPNEHRAMEFALRKFREFGLQEAFILPMRQTVSVTEGGAINTNSGTAVGVLKGKTSRTIVIGGHIDSAGPDIPGANDDGSGSATVIELARVLSQRENESTIVFALFGGEEQGLRGSRNFALNFDRMADVVLMLQIDMTNGTKWLLPLVDAKDHMTPEWLVKASYEEFYALGYEGLSFPTHFYSFLTSTPGGGIGSDHEPFLEKGIPAIDFTSDVTDPIHVPQDNLANFIPSGLKQSGDLVYRLVERFDAGVPPETSGSYYLFQIGSTLLFFPIWALYVFSVLAFALGVFALLRMRRSRSVDAQKQKIPGLKLFALMLIIQTCVWLSENIVGLLKGTRFPWLAQYDGYFLLGFLAAGVGIWFCLQLVPKMGFSRDPYRYAFRGIISLAVLLVLMVAVSPKIGLAAAMGLFFLSLAFIVDPWYLKVLFWVVSPHFMYRLIFSEGFGLIARSVTLIPLQGFISSLILHAFYIFFFSLWAFPFLLGFAAIRFQKPESFAIIPLLRSRIGGVVALGLFAGCVIYLSLEPTFSPAWQQLVTIRQQVDQTANTASIRLQSSDYLAGTTLQFDGKDTTLTGWDRDVSIRNAEFEGQPWVWVERTVNTDDGTNTTFTMTMRFHFKYRPYRFQVTYRGGTAPLENVDSPLAYSPEGKSVMFRWYSFPDTLLEVPLRATVVGSDSLSESFEATFVEQYVAVRAQKEDATTRNQTIVVASDVIHKQ